MPGENFFLTSHIFFCLSCKNFELCFFCFFFLSAGLNSHGSWQTENGLHNLMLWKEAISREICFAALPPAAHIFKSPFGRATLLSYLSPLSKKEKKKKTSLSQLQNLCHNCQTLKRARLHTLSWLFIRYNIKTYCSLMQPSYFFVQAFF